MLCVQINFRLYESGFNGIITTESKFLAHPDHIPVVGQDVRDDLLQLLVPADFDKTPEQFLAQSLVL
jgi:hypothetical protein